MINFIISTIRENDPIHFIYCWRIGLPGLKNLVSVVATIRADKVECPMIGCMIDANPDLARHIIGELIHDIVLVIKNDGFPRVNAYGGKERFENVTPPRDNDSSHDVDAIDMATG